MKPKRTLFQKKKRIQNPEMTLQITSMADVFTILLVFLLKGVASDAIQITPSNGVSLPSGMHAKNLKETALQVEITKGGILVEKEKIMELEGSFKPLQERLQKEREKQKFIAEKNESVKASNEVILITDKDIPFSTVKQVLKNLSEEGFSEVKLAAIQAQP